MFNEIEAVKDYLGGKKIPVRALDDCVFQIAKFMKEEGATRIDTKVVVKEWLTRCGLYFVDINNNIDNAFITKSKLIGDFKVYINQADIDAINFAADFKVSKKIALFLLIYAKLHADHDGNFKIRIATMAEWVGVKRENIYARHIAPLVEYGFIEIPDHNTYSKYLNKKRDEKRMSMRICHPLVNDGEYFIENNEDFESLFNRIFVG